MFEEKLKFFKKKILRLIKKNQKMFLKNLKIYHSKENFYFELFGKFSFVFAFSPNLCRIFCLIISR